MKAYAIIAFAFLLLIACIAETHADISHAGFTYGDGVSQDTGLLWYYWAGGAVYSAPVVADGIVYFGSEDCKVYALNGTTGAQVWNYTTGGPVYSPAVYYGTVYIGSGDSKVYALNATTGTQLWNYTGTDGNSAPVVANGIVYFGGNRGKVLALDATTGSLVWEYRASDDVSSDVVTRPVVANGVVYFGDYYSVRMDSSIRYGRLIALNATTGAKIWNFSTSWRYFATPAVENGTVYVGNHILSGTKYDDYGKVYALNASTGTQVWDYTTRNSVYSTPAVEDGIVLIGCNDYAVYALNAKTGEFLWNHTIGFFGYASPVVTNGTVYAAISAGGWGMVYAYNASNGKLVWSYQSAGFEDRMSTPAVANGTVYVGSGDGRVFAIGYVAPEPSPGPSQIPFVGVEVLGAMGLGAMLYVSSRRKR